MIDLDNIKDFAIPRPNPNFIGTAKEFDDLPQTHKEQILFLDKLPKNIFLNLHSLRT